jgi:four helix bundle protein
VNIAEGDGKRSEADRCRSYDIARGSAHECAAVLDVARILKLLES